MSTVRQFVYLFASIDWTSETITAASTAAIAFLTLILAVGTLFLWRATAETRFCNMNISSQLLFGGVLSASYQTISRHGLMSNCPDGNDAD
jgi:hypothetical protein